MSNAPLSILVLGASYGLTLGIRSALVGHRVDFVCLPEEAKLINAGQFSLCVAARNADTMLELGVADCTHPPCATGPEEVSVDTYDFAVLAMQEPQYSAPALTDLVTRLQESRIPCISIMNMPLPNYLAASLGITLSDELLGIYHNPALWTGFDPALFTAASPDPQVIRTPTEDWLQLDVTLPSNLKIAPFRNQPAQNILQRLAGDLDVTMVERDGNKIFPRLRLIAHPSNYVPLAKWPMLLTGNFRCFREGPPVSIAQAVLEDVETSSSIYAWVSALCTDLIGSEVALHENTFVPFERYCEAAVALSYPSSIARGIANGATRVERVDKLIQLLGRTRGENHPAVDAIVKDVDRRLAHNQLQSVPTQQDIKR